MVRRNFIVYSCLFFSVYKKLSVWLRVRDGLDYPGKIKTTKNVRLKFLEEYATIIPLQNNCDW